MRPALTGGPRGTRSQPFVHQRKVPRRLTGCWAKTHRDFEIDRLIANGAHLVIETELIFAGFVGREDEISLTLFRAIEDDFTGGREDLVVDVEGTASLDLGEIVLVD